MAGNEPLLYFIKLEIQVRTETFNLKPLVEIGVPRARATAGTAPLQTPWGLARRFHSTRCMFPHPGSGGTLDRALSRSDKLASAVGQSLTFASVGHAQAMLNGADMGAPKYST
jgi:hypothetical protein